MPTALPDTFFKVVGRTLIENDTKFQYQLQQVPNPNAPVPAGPSPMGDPASGMPAVTSDRNSPILEETVIKLSRTWEVYQSA